MNFKFKNLFKVFAVVLSLSATSVTAFAQSEDITVAYDEKNIDVPYFESNDI